MSACEWCWTEAKRRGLLLGGSVTAHYHEILREQEVLEDCPEYREHKQRGAR